MIFIIFDLRATLWVDLVILMHGPYPMQYVYEHAPAKGGTCVQECRLSVTYDAFDRLRHGFRLI